MQRITISLDDELYRVVKAYAQSEGLSLSKAVVRLMRRGMGGRAGAGPTRLREDSPATTYREPRTGILVSRGAGTITGDAVKKAEEEEDKRKWDPR